MPKNSVKWRTEEKRSRIKAARQTRTGPTPATATCLRAPPGEEFYSCSWNPFQVPCTALSLSHIVSLFLSRSACLLSASLGIYSFMHFVSVSLFFHMQIFCVSFSVKYMVYMDSVGRITLSVQQIQIQIHTHKYICCTYTCSKSIRAKEKPHKAPRTIPETVCLLSHLLLLLCCCQGHESSHKPKRATFIKAKPTKGIPGYNANMRSWSITQSNSRRECSINCVKDHEALWLDYYDSSNYFLGRLPEDLAQNSNNYNLL